MSPPNLAGPRLWVENIWLLDSLEAEQPIREIRLERGLNLIVSPPQDGSTGHGVGKTAFCQLVRFVLEDPLWASGSSLRDELLNYCKDGAVAARVHVGDEVWTVVKPWQHQKKFRASRSATWQELARGGVENDHAAYAAALQIHLVDCLPVREVPGSQQLIQWHHILAWCSRDQNARYQSYYQWRAEGAGFTLPAKSPAFLVRVVLGLLNDATTLQELEKVEGSIKSTEKEVQSLRDQPAYLLAHVRRQLARQLDAREETLFQQEGLFHHTNLLDLAKQRLEGYEQELSRIEAEQRDAETVRQDLIEQRAPLKVSIDLLTNTIAQREAAIAGDWARIEQLKSEASSLQQRLATKCDAGNVLLQECSYVEKRIREVQIDRYQGIAKHSQSSKELEAEVAPYRERLRELQSHCAPIDARLAAITKGAPELARRNATVLRDMQRLREAIDDFEVYRNVVAGKQQWVKLVDAEARLNALQDRGALLEAKYEAEREAAQGRRRVIDGLMQRVAKGLPRFGWGVFDDDEKHKGRPFRMGPPHSTTFGVLETLAGDIACLIDSTNSQSFHPGFLLHDSPREAEMSEAMFWALTAIVRDHPDPAFQYIVTTSTRAEQTFEPFVRLELSSKDDTGLLFRRRIGVEEPQGLL